MTDQYAPVPILQFWDKDTPAYIQDLLDSVRDLNPERTYRLFNDESARAFIEDRYDRSVVRAYDVCAIPAMRSDLFRYCFLYECGGWYIDADFRCVQPLDPLADLAPRGYLYVHNDGITNSSLLIRHPKDPLMATVVDTAIANIQRLRDSSNVWEVTGPAIFHTLHSDEAQQSLFSEFAIIDDVRFFRFCHPVAHLPYKTTDAHWVVAWEKNLPIYGKAN